MKLADERFRELRVFPAHTEDDVLDIDQMRDMSDRCPHCGGDVWVGTVGLSELTVCCQSCGRMSLWRCNDEVVFGR
jgi:hypothetical protein